MPPLSRDSCNEVGSAARLALHGLPFTIILASTRDLRRQNQGIWPKSSRGSIVIFPLRSYSEAEVEIMKRFYVVLSISLGLAGLSSLAKADEWDKRTVITFNHPVEIPGTVLAAGTYVMRLADSQSDRNGSGVLEQRRNAQLDAMVMAIPVYRMNPPDQTVITFEERAANAPQAIKEWFYPGDNTVEEIIYKKPVLSGSRRSGPVNCIAASRSARCSGSSAAGGWAPPAPQAQQQPVEIAQAKPASAPAPTPTAPASPALANTQPQKELPKTASDLGLVAMLGGISLFAGLFLRRIA